MLTPLLFDGYTPWMRRIEVAKTLFLSYISTITRVEKWLQKQ